MSRAGRRVSGCVAAYAVVQCFGLSGCGCAGGAVAGGIADWGADCGAAFEDEVALGYTPTGKGLGLDSSVLAPGFFQRSKRPCSRLMRPVYQ
jgi:hypothetical protein